MEREVKGEKSFDLIQDEDLLEAISSSSQWGLKYNKNSKFNQFPSLNSSTLKFILAIHYG